MSPSRELGVTLPLGPRIGLAQHLPVGLVKPCTHLKVARFQMSVPAMGPHTRGWSTVPDEPPDPPLGGTLMPVVAPVAPLPPESITPLEAAAPLRDAPAS